MSDILNTTTYLNTSTNLVRQSPRDAYYYLLYPSAGLLTNVVFQLTVLQHPSLRKTVFSLYLIILSWMDCLSCLAFAFLLYQGVKLFHIYFHYTYVFLHTLHTLSSILITFILWERYKAVYRPIQTMTSHVNLRKNFFISITGVIVGFCVLYPAFYVIWTYTYTTDTPYFYPVLALIDCVTLLTCIAIYARILKNFKNSPLKRNVGDSKQRYKLEMNLTVVALINTLVFFLLSVIQHILPAIEILSIDEPGTFQQIQLQCLMVNSLVNPIIYNVFGKRYRSALAETLTCFRRRRSNTKIPEKNHGVSIPLDDEEREQKPQ
ncbi:hypothetical protein HOLleu_22903 [Holothuria leucospilota]|uniref:G-protein coupled receptors family 1 profile domain-containing protein n=1 Tax=Holothuria leucospilota TaxID=206669 RepID=A0A9Q1BUD5_HOLLE|nr:hypothetical protein HOLleu_22903 [Holothuria leucospilota]